MITYLIAMGFWLVASIAITIGFVLVVDAVVFFGRTPFKEVEK